MGLRLVLPDARMPVVTWRQAIWIKDGNIVCPVHRYGFNLENGRDIAGEGLLFKDLSGKSE